MHSENRSTPNNLIPFPLKVENSFAFDDETDDQLFATVKENAVAVARAHVAYNKIGKGIPFDKPDFPYQEKVKAGFDLVRCFAESEMSRNLAKQRKLKLEEPFSREYPFAEEVVKIAKWLDQICLNG
jgi:hypothetical protein